ncbi:IclR family transcriptional regulator [Pseudorhodoferax soli]|uniref:IclR family transcriptional regulator n=1 Tax=Pseudorhodoferax soli TaxID=545864 RepID=A0A368XK14_9BURK|nr:helix-turn-helix domain-containing protein [Pseudorhodoferax soli]RCW67516.1 IclR family transcriptional regulator [Pseudorhodoferax soli]
MDEKTPSTIKSARRVLEVLELFAERRGPATVSAVAEALDYPLSSTSVLLRSLERLGYLQQDTATREFRPTLRVMLLGTWMHDDLFGQGSLLSSMNTLRLRTGQTVMVGLRQGVHVRFILSLPSLRANGLKFPVGVMRPVCQSSVGKMLLTRETDRDVQRIARAANAQAEPEQRVDVAALLDEVRRSRLQGWAETRDYPRTGFATLAVLLPDLPGQAPMAVTLGMRLETLQARADTLRQALQESARRLVS